MKLANNKKNRKLAREFQNDEIRRESKNRSRHAKFHNVSIEDCAMVVDWFKKQKAATILYDVKKGALAGVRMLLLREMLNTDELIYILGRSQNAVIGRKTKSADVADGLTAEALYDLTRVTVNYVKSSSLEKGGENDEDSE